MRATEPLSVYLERLQPKALAVLEEVVDTNVRGFDPDDAKTLNIKRQAAVDILNTQIKVNDTLLKSKQDDKLVQILKEWKEWKVKLYGPVIDVTPEK